ncbi:MAG: histidinol-phosphatase HisJ [Liquorilactobacillus hordei]|uniref:histidinol-phosphatase HisJ n=1 Tax=Liquorilactobacillus hordei TaxID=468911 RepID=UPI0039E8AB42
MLNLEQLREIPRDSWSGHNHTEFCSHGSGEDIELYIQKAIAAGFKTYSITEHFPLPQAFYENVVGSAHSIYTAAMRINELPKYFTKMQNIKLKYQDKIKILIGFEIDYISEFREWTQKQLIKYADQIDDAILSVHFLPTKAGLSAVDDSLIDFKNGVLAEYKTPVNVAQAYLVTVLEAVLWDAQYKPKRYGHIMLYRKWRNEFSCNTIWEDEAVQNKLRSILDVIADKNEFLDCNFSGLFRSTQTETSPNYNWIEEAQKRKIPLVYGADAHKVASVSAGFNTYLESKYYL